MVDFQAFGQIQTRGGEGDLGWESWRARVESIYNLDRGEASTRAQLSFSLLPDSASLKTIPSSAVPLRREKPLSCLGLSHRNMSWHPSQVPNTGFRRSSCRTLCQAEGGTPNRIQQGYLGVSTAGESDPTSVKSPALGLALYFQLLLTDQ